MPNPPNKPADTDSADYQPVVQTDKGRIFVIYPVFEFRILFADGSTTEVRAIKDDSKIREQILKGRMYAKDYGDRIVGVSDGQFLGWVSANDWKDTDE